MKALSSNTWDFRPEIKHDRLIHHMSLLNVLIEAGNEMYRATGEHLSNLLHCGSAAASMIKTLPTFKRYVSDDHKKLIGILSERWQVYESDQVSEDAILSSYNFQEPMVFTTIKNYDPTVLVEYLLGCLRNSGTRWR